MLTLAIAACGESGGPSAGGTGSGTGSGTGPGTGTAATGEALYTQYCASCHGRNLEGQPNWRERKADGILPAPPHDETGHTWHHSDKLLFSYTKLGGQKLIGGSFKSGMPGFGETLSDDQIRAVLAHIKAQWPDKIRERQAGITRAQDGN